MSFFETASLVLISDFAAASASAVSGSGTNTGKAYSIKPTDGSGDFNFERGSDITATRVNSSGLIEKGRGNFLLQSNNFDTTWVKSSVNLTGSQSGYDGSNDAWILRKTGTTGAISQTVASLTNLQTFSIYAKPGDLNWIRIIRAGKSIFVDLENQVTGSVGGGIIDVKITPINEWSRITFTVSQTSTNTVIYPADGDNDISGTSGFIYIQDAQLEQGLVATDVIETTTEPLRAGVLEDEPRFDYHNSASATPNTCPSLLLEPERTNLVLQSEYANAGSVSLATITDNVTTSPEGVQNAARFLPTSAFGRWESQPFGSSITNGNTYAASAYFNTSSTLDIVTFYIGWNGATGADRIGIKFNPNTRAYISTFSAGSGTLTDYDIGEADENGWYRVSLIAPAANPNSSTCLVLRDLDSQADGSKYVDFYGWQLEEGSYPTSYIPTYGTAATRGEDSSTSGTISNVTEGVLYFEGSVDKNENTIKLIEFNDGGLLNVIQLYYRDSTGTQPRVYAIAKSGGTQVYGYAYNIPSGRGEITHKVAFRFADNDFALFYNGTKVHSQTSGTISTNPKNQVMYETSAGAIPFRGNVKQTIVFPEALSDTDCEILTGATTYSSFAAMASALNYTVYE